MDLSNLTEEERREYIKANYAEAVSMDQLTEEDSHLVKMASNIAREQLLTHGKIIPFTLIVTGDNELVATSPGGFADEGDKNGYVLSTKLISATKRAKAVLFVSESWAFKGDTPESMKAFNDWRDSEGADKSFADYPGPGVSEAIIYSLESRNGVVSTREEISRTNNRPYVSEEHHAQLFEGEYFTAESMAEKKLPIGGRFIGLLPPLEVLNGPNFPLIVEGAKRMLSVMFDIHEVATTSLNEDPAVIASRLKERAAAH